MTNEDYKKFAQKLVGQDATVDERAQVQRVSNGAFVEAWVWVSDYYIENNQENLHTVSGI